MHDVHCALGGINSGLFSQSGSSSLQNTVPVDAVQTYATYYHRLDNVLRAVENGPVGVVRTGAELMPLVRNSSFYEDWLRPLDIDDGLFVRLTDGPGTTSLIVAAPKRSLSFDTLDRLKVMGALVVHFQQALRIQEKFDALAGHTVELAGALEAVRHGIITVTVDDVVVHLNSAAEQILHACDGLSVHSGRLTATSTRAERELLRALHDALAVDSGSVPTSRSLTCARPSGKRPYIIHVLPSPPHDTDHPPRHNTALVMVIDPEAEPEAPMALMRRFYRLTRAEADVALRMMHGADPKQISDELSVSLTTVRTHLQRVFEKTDTHRQAELVRLLLVSIG
jgi:DNA-binding CsgD family transcriptional regulator